MAIDPGKPRRVLILNRKKQQHRRPAGPVRAVCLLPQASAPCAVNETTAAHWFYSRAVRRCVEERSCNSTRPGANQFPTEEACAAACPNGNDTSNRWARTNANVVFPHRCCSC